MRHPAAGIAARLAASISSRSSSQLSVTLLRLAAICIATE
jgi:hypothetical protein